MKRRTKLDDCVAKVSRNKKIVNAFAVCNASLRRKTRLKNPKEPGFQVCMGPTLKKVKLIWTALTLEDAKFIAKTFAKTNPSQYVLVRKP